MRILITGSSGLIGSHLIPFLEKQGHEIFRLVRSLDNTDKSKLYWNPTKGELDKNVLENFQVVIHLAGENISSRRWSKKQKKKIRESRITSTRLLVEQFKKTKPLPLLFICASAIGFYGDRGKEMLTETSLKGEGFLADLVGEWEENASSVEDVGIRVVLLRTGVVLSSQGGALTKILMPFKTGFGTVIGDGQQYMSWISSDDVNGVMDFILKNEAISGPVNVVAPEAITNYEYSQALGKVLTRPVFLKIPGSILRLVLGEMAEQLLLSSTKVVPRVLIDHGYKFIHENIDQALAELLKDR